VLAEAEDLNQPLIAKAVTAGQDSTWSAVTVDGLTLALSGFKTAEDGERLVLRAWEPAGARGATGVSLAEGWKLAGEVDILEERIGEADRYFKPFQIRSWLVERDAP
jgi:alpha-mannosidase